MPEFYVIIARKNIFSRILGGTAPPAPRLYAYGKKVKENICYSIPT